MWTGLMERNVSTIDVVFSEPLTIHRVGLAVCTFENEYFIWLLVRQVPPLLALVEVNLDVLSDPS